MPVSSYFDISYFIHHKNLEDVKLGNMKVEDRKYRAEKTMAVVRIYIDPVKIVIMFIL